MYKFILIASLIAALWLAIERPRSSTWILIARFGALSYGIFAILSGLFWIFFPAATAQLVPGHAGGVLVAVATQARGLIGIALGAVSILTRKMAPRSLASILLGPLIYNGVMSVEALAAQFTALATSERWLYVAFHFGWALTFALRFLPSEPSSLSVTSMKQDTLQLLLRTFSAIAVVIGIGLFSIPYALMKETMTPAASAFLAHSAHGLASACIALGAMTFVTTSHQASSTPILDSLAVGGSCIGVAILGVMSASQQGGLEAPIRLAAILCALCAGLSFLRTRSSAR